GLVRPVQTAGGVLVRSNADAALFAMMGPPGRRRLAWVVTPGDRILSLQAIGRTLVVTTGDRRIVGYDERGRWLWEVSRPDVVQNRALPVTETTFAVAGVDGAVELRALATGAVVWRADIGSAINAVSTDPAARAVHVIDDTGVVTEFGADSPTPRWQQEVSAGPAQLASSAGGTTVLLPNALHRLAAGEEVWRTSLAFANRIDVDAQHAYVVADRHLRAYDLASGTVRWSRAGVRTTAVPRQTTSVPQTAGSVAVLAADGAVLAALAADGEVLAEVDVDLHNQGRLVPLADGVLVHWAPDPELVSWERDG
ncbi:MAG: outer membrane protein assembly factor BamB family protein, partial [Propionibacteriaceae bacterium]